MRGLKARPSWRRAAVVASVCVTQGNYLLKMGTKMGHPKKKFLARRGSLSLMPSSRNPLRAHPSPRGRRRARIGDAFQTDRTSGPVPCFCQGHDGRLAGRRRAGAFDIDLMPLILHTSSSQNAAKLASLQSQLDDLVWKAFGCEDGSFGNTKTGQCEGDLYSWRAPPQEGFGRCAESLHKTLVNRSRQVRSTSQLGRDMEYWGSCAQIVMRMQTAILEGGSCR